MKTTTKSLRRKKGAEKISMITAYDALFARLADEAGADIILVGDSLGNVYLGFDSTVPVTLDMMRHHVAAVARATAGAMVLADLPFALAHRSFDSLLDDCASLLRAGAHAVKIEGGAKIADKIAALCEAGIPVMGHIGLEPQQYLKLGGYRKFGKTPQERDAIIGDALALERAGAFALLLEMCDADAAKAVSESVKIPVVGIGSGPDCDGQVLVFSDALGLTENPPPFAKKFANLRADVLRAYETFFSEIKSGAFPERGK